MKLYWKVIRTIYKATLKTLGQDIESNKKLDEQVLCVIESSAINASSLAAERRRVLKECNSKYPPIQAWNPYDRSAVYSDTTIKGILK